jgi:hypothetical protein
MDSSCGTCMVQETTWLQRQSALAARNGLAEVDTLSVGVKLLIGST